MSLVNFTNLDFDQIRDSIKSYLRLNPNFTDYDFEGSNLSTIIDVLAYNTYITSYNANMVSNEVFIDSATLRENVISLARNIGYVPNSKKSAKTKISFTVNTSNSTISPVTLTLKKGVVASSSLAFGNQSYVFTIPEDITVKVNNNLAIFSNVEVYEGTFIEESFTTNQYNTSQRFILNNSGIDTRTIRVNVRTSENSTVSRKFRLADSLFQITPESPVFFIQEVEDERYELIFGDGIFGVNVKYPEFVEVSYIISNGVSGNGINQLRYNGRILDNANNIITSEISSLIVSEPSRGGSDIESIESIKKYAPRIYASQNRAVTSADYEALVPRIYPDTESVSVYGGEDLSPPSYGKVFISIKPYNDAYLPNLVKDNIKNELRKYSVAGIVTEIVDLKYLYLEIESNIYYNTNLARSSNDVKTIIMNNINKYSDSSELNKFGARFKYSKFLKILDDSHPSITSNITTVNIRRDLRASLNAFAEYEICFGNRFNIKDNRGYNIKSSGFNVAGVVDKVYMADIPNADGKTGRVVLFKLSSPTQPEIVRGNIGTIDYIKGEIRLSVINITSTDINRGTPIIEISASPYSNDVIGLQDLYLQLDISKTNVNLVSDTIESGYDASGSNYIVSSSYSNGNLVR